MGNHCDKTSPTYSDNECAFCTASYSSYDKEKCSVCDPAQTSTYNKDKCNTYVIPNNVMQTTADKDGNVSKTPVVFGTSSGGGTTTAQPTYADPSQNMQPITNPYLEAAPTSGGTPPSNGSGSSMAGAIAIILILIIVGVGVAVIIKKKRATK